MLKYGKIVILLGLVAGVMKI